MQVSSVMEQLLFSTVRIQTKASGGREGVGTGALVTVQSDDGEIPVLVTNRHVIDGSSSMTLSFVQSDGAQPILGKRLALTVDDPGSQWVYPEEPNIDLAAMPANGVIAHLTSLGTPPFIRSIPESIALSDGEAVDLDALENLVFIGYPNDIWDTTNGLPVVRRGITATPLSVDFEGEPAFLMDGSVFPGSSGSPVFIVDVGMFRRKQGGTVIGSRIHFVGTVAMVYVKKEEGRIEARPAPIAVEPIPIVNQMIDLGYVIKAQQVVRLARRTLKRLKRPREP